MRSLIKTGTCHRMSHPLPRLPPSKAFPRSDLGGKQRRSRQHGGVSVAFTSKTSVCSHRRSHRELCSVRWRAAGRRRRTRRRTRAGRSWGFLAVEVWRGDEVCGAPGQCRPCGCPQDWNQRGRLACSGGGPTNPSAFIGTSLCPEECDGGCQRCVVCLWNSAFLPPPIAKSVDERIAPLASLAFARPSALFIPRFCGFPSAASPCCRWSLISWAGGCWGRPSEGSSHTHPSSCSGRL